MDRTVIRHGDIAIGRHRQLLGALGITIHVDDQLIAGTQHVVLGRGNVHHRLEGEALVVENITTEHFLALHIEIVACGRHLSTLNHIIGGLLQHLLLELLLVGLLGGIVLAHALGIAYRLVGSTSHAGSLQLLGVLLAHTLNLFERGSPSQQILGNGALGLAQLFLLHDVLQNLRVTHTLSEGCQRQAKGQ